MRTPLSRSAVLVAKELLEAADGRTTLTIGEHEVGAKIGHEADTIYRALRSLEEQGAIDYSRHPGTRPSRNPGRTVTLHLESPIWAFVQIVTATVEVAR